MGQILPAATRTTASITGTCPMMAKGHTEAQCVKCHQGVVEVPKAATPQHRAPSSSRSTAATAATRSRAGRTCARSAPTSPRSLSKTNEEWIFRWIKEPKGFRPTRMPQVWDVRAARDAEQLKARNDVEANAVVAYLVEKSGRETYPAPPAGDLEAGPQGLRDRGLPGLPPRGRRPARRGRLPTAPCARGWTWRSFRAHGPNLDGTGSKVNAGWLYAWVRNPKGYWHETRMPNLRLTEKEAADITAYLMSLQERRVPGPPAPGAATPRSATTIIREHLLAASVPVKRGRAAARRHGRPRSARSSWARRRSAATAASAATTSPGFEKTSPIGVELTEEGSKLVERLDFGFQHGKIPHTLPGLGPPEGEGAAHLRRAARSKKPEELLRMPKFWVTDEEADAIVTAVMSFTKEQVPLAAQKQLAADEKYVRARARAWCATTTAAAATRSASRAAASARWCADQLEAAGGDSLQLQALGLSPPLLYNAKAKIGEGSRVHTRLAARLPARPVRTRSGPGSTCACRPSTSREEELNTLTRYFAALDGVPYPYAPRAEPDPALLASGQDLFKKWQCIKCHVVARQAAQPGRRRTWPPTSPTCPTACARSGWPLAGRPGRIQPGTRMPANFPKDPAENAFPEILGGDQAKQIEAVRAYLLTLGQGAAARPLRLRARPRPDRPPPEARADSAREVRWTRTPAPSPRGRDTRSWSGPWGRIVTRPR